MPTRPSAHGERHDHAHHRPTLAGLAHVPPRWLDRRSRDVRRAQRDVQLTAAEPRADTLRGRTRHLAKAMAARDRGVSDGRVHVAV
jgi:hypothetical protein